MLNMKLPLYFTNKVNGDISKTIKSAFEKKKEEVVVKATGSTVFSLLKALSKIRPTGKLTVEEYKEISNANKAVIALIKSCA